MSNFSETSSWRGADSPTSAPRPPPARNVDNVDEPSGGSSEWGLGGSHHHSKQSNFSDTSSWRGSQFAESEYGSGEGDDLPVVIVRKPKTPRTKIRAMVEERKLKDEYMQKKAKQKEDKETEKKALPPRTKKGNRGDSFGAHLTAIGDGGGGVGGASGSGAVGGAPAAAAQDEGEGGGVAIAKAAKASAACCSGKAASVDAIMPRSPLSPPSPVKRKSFSTLRLLKEPPSLDALKEKVDEMWELAEKTKMEGAEIDRFACWQYILSDPDLARLIGESQQGDTAKGKAILMAMKEVGR